MIRPATLAILISTVLPTALSAQPDELRFERLSVEHGLSHSSVWALLQDSRGFLWIGTQGGLNRYDGYRFEVYKHDPEDPDSISDSEVMAIHEGRGGDLWLATRGGGLNRWWRAEERFEHWRHDPGDLDRLTGAAGSPAAPDNLRFARYRHDPADPQSLVNDSVSTIYEDRTDILWIGTYGGLARHARASERFITYRQRPGRQPSLSSNGIWAIHQDRRGELWIGTYESGLDRLDRRRGTVAHYPPARDALPHGTVSAILEDRQGVLWIGTWGGLVRLDRSSGGERLSIYNHDPEKPGRLRSDMVVALAEDRRGRLWIGTMQGLHRLDAGAPGDELHRYPRPGSREPGAGLDLRHPRGSRRRRLVRSSRRRTLPAPGGCRTGRR